MTSDNNIINRRSFIGAIGLAGASAIAGCSGESGNSSTADSSTASSSSTSGGQLRTSVSRKPESLNPILHVNGAEYQVTGWLYSNLVRVDTNLNLQPDLAVDWEANSDASQWTFNLRDNATFNHSGEQVTARDVKATINKITDPDVGSPGKGTIGPIDTVEAVDDTTVRINLTGPYADIPKKMAKQFVRILPADVLKNEFDSIATTDYGSGPFNLEEFTVGDSIRVSRNPEYYLTDDQGNQLPHVNEVVQKVYPEAVAEISAMGNNGVDIMWEAPPSQFSRLQQQSGTEPMRVSGGSFANLVMRSDRPPFDDNRVRRAVKHAIDKEQVLQSAQDGFGRTAQHTPISPAYQYHTDLEPIKHDPDRAIELLNEAGHEDGIEMELFAANEPSVRVDSAVVMKEMLSEVNIDVEISQISYDQYIENVWKQAPMYMGFYGMRFTEDGILYLLLHSQGEWNEASWSDEEFDQTLNQARQTTDQQKRAELYAKAQQIVHDRGPYAIPFFQEEVSARREYVVDYELHPTGFFVPVTNVQLSDGAPQR